MDSSKFAIQACLKIANLDESAGGDDRNRPFGAATPGVAKRARKSSTGAFATEQNLISDAFYRLRNQILRGQSSSGRLTGAFEAPGASAPHSRRVGVLNSYHGGIGGSVHNCPASIRYFSEIACTDDLGTVQK